MKKQILLAAIAIGIINATLLVVFEFIGIQITNWLWNDVLHTDEYRWLVVPVAVVFGIILAATFLRLRQKRLEDPTVDLLTELDEAPASLSGIGVGLTIGAVSLLAGASLGPEASLMAASGGIGTYAASRGKLSPMKKLLILASIGALLVAFFDSMVVTLIPLLLLVQSSRRAKTRPSIAPIAVIILSGLMSFGTLTVLNHLTGETGGYGSPLALPEFVARDFIVAIGIGFVSSGLAALLSWLIVKFWKTAQHMEAIHIPGGQWTLGGIYGLVLGTLYLLGGRTVQFSGSIGSNLLLHDSARYGAAALVGLAVIKLLATSWSKATGYRGGLVFPSVYAGIALGLLAGQLVNDIAGAGAVVGGITGMMIAAIGNPVLGSIFVIAFLPLSLWPIALCALVGTLAFAWVKKRFIISSSQPTTTQN